MGCRSRMSQSLILIDALTSAYWERKKREREMAGGLFSQGKTHLVGCVVQNFCSC
jgi:hypothetical protein